VSALEVRRDDAAATRWVTDAPVELADGQARFAIDHVGLSANNVSFAITGDMLGYWKLFPTGDPAWGRVPTFGFADVVASRHPEVAVGRRVFGYLPMAQHLVVAPAKVDARGLLDGSAHRRDVMATVWNHYQWVPTGTDRVGEAIRSLLRPLFVTAFLIDDVVADQDRFGADTVILTSASARTAVATADAMRRRGDLRVVGLTSAGRVGFVSGLGAYDEVLAYEQAGDVPGGDAVLVDIAGLVGVRDAVHARFGDRLRHSMTVGISNVPDPARLAAPPPPIGPAPELFFAQLQVAKRAHDWGQDELDRRIDEAWERFVAFAGTWLRIEEQVGPEAIEGAWLDLVAGRVDPAVGVALAIGGGAGVDHRPGSPG
jgi:hypothetical protein